jgi:ATP-dependent Clp protease ATP-binding subunit ClpX
VRQYEKLFEMEDVELIIEEDALRAVAKLAIERKTGARGLRAILEEMMLNLMFDIPSSKDVQKVVVTRECVEDGEEPLVYTDRDQLKVREA